MNNDLISREALKKAITQNREIDRNSVCDVLDIIDNAPTVITNSVYEAYCALSDEEFEHSDSFWITTPKGKKINFVKERPQGEWVDTGRMEEYWEEEYQCSICGVKDHWHNFCPNCGADMRKETDND